MSGYHACSKRNKPRIKPMKTSEIGTHDIDVESQSDRGSGDDTRVLLLALKELVEQLSRVGVDGPACELVVEKWEGGQYLYLETALLSAADTEIDVSIQDGRAFIRMGR
jgi:hypothetical protein